MVLFLLVLNNILTAAYWSVMYTQVVLVVASGIIVAYELISGSFNIAVITGTA